MDTIKKLSAFLALILLAAFFGACAGSSDPVQDLEDLGDDFTEALPGLGPGVDPEEGT